MFPKEFGRKDSLLIFLEAIGGGEKLLNKAFFLRKGLQRW